MFFMRKTTGCRVPEALPGRDTPIPTPPPNFVNGRKLQRLIPQALSRQYSARLFLGRRSQILAARRGIFCDAGRLRRRPHQESNLRRGLLGSHRHTEVVLVVFDPNKISSKAVKTFWEKPQPTQGMRQGMTSAPISSAIYTFGDANAKPADALEGTYQKALGGQGSRRITTESQPRPRSILPRTIISQYLAKKSAGYCGLAAPGCRARSAPAWPPERPVFPTTGALPPRVPQRTQKNALLNHNPVKTRAVSLWRDGPVRVVRRFDFRSL